MSVSDFRKLFLVLSHPPTKAIDSFALILSGFPVCLQTNTALCLKTVYLTEAEAATALSAGRDLIGIAKTGAPLSITLHVLMFGCLE